MKHTPTRIARDIVDYLNENPEAEDTLEGIAEWWLIRQRLGAAVADVRKAVAELLEHGLLLRVHANDGVSRYRLNFAKRGELKALLGTAESDPEGDAGSRR